MEFRSVEAVTAFYSLATSQMAEADGYTGEGFRGLPVFAERFRLPSNCILKTGFPLSRFPPLFIVPLDKPHLDPLLCTDKRPIFLICALVEILEVTVLN